jgi:hypothetical protein
MIPYEELAAALARHTGRHASAGAPAAHDTTHAGHAGVPQDDSTMNGSPEEEIGEIVAEEEA